MQQISNPCQRRRRRSYVSGGEVRYEKAEVLSF
jgi:hypothetical protein